MLMAVKGPAGAVLASSVCVWRLHLGRRGQGGGCHKNGHLVLKTDSSALLASGLSSPCC